MDAQGENAMIAQDAEFVVQQQQQQRRIVTPVMTYRRPVTPQAPGKPYRGRGGGQRIPFPVLGDE
jgi:hypothetical protein